MSIQINHAIVAASESCLSASFFAQVFGLPAPTKWGSFHTVLLGDGAHLHFATPPGISKIQFQHYAFKVDEQKFGDVYAQLQQLEVEHWADPQQRLPNQGNSNHGGRGVYFRDPKGSSSSSWFKPKVIRVSQQVSGQFITR